MGMKWIVMTVIVDCAMRCANCGDEERSTGRVQQPRGLIAPVSLQPAGVSFYLFILYSLYNIFNVVFSQQIHSTP